MRSDKIDRGFPAIRLADNQQAMIAEAIDRHADELAAIESLDVAMPL
jgi:hypothetical protein